MNVLKVSLLALAVAATASPFAADAANPTANFGVQLTVQNSCTITAGNTASDINFGTVTGNISSNIDASTDLTVNCNNGANYKVGLSDGANSPASGQRRMKSGTTTQFVNYELYSDSARTARWGVLGTSEALAGVGNNANQTLTVYGRVPASQSVGAGVYNDTITATIEF